MKIVIGNWKMNVGTRESVALARGVLLALRGSKTLPETIVCPPFVALADVRKIVARTHVSLGAQAMHPDESGAFTGEISARMLEELGVTHVILGHSERRAMGETDAYVQRAVQTAFARGLTPIVCVGESREERESGTAAARVTAQVHAALRGVAPKRDAHLLIAYEPLWAIGSGTPCTPAEAVLMLETIRAAAHDVLPILTPRLIYGGSVNGENSYSYLREARIDGVLVGGASIRLNEFSEILRAAIDATEGAAVGV